jgi:predicted alpha/beta superfamily hydrolase
VRWRSYTATDAVGDLRVLQGELDRDLWVWLPPGHDEGDRRYPALYLHDAQNLFDEATAGGADWRVDEALTALAGEGLPLIAVGLPHAGVLRRDEYMGSGLDRHVGRLLAAKRIVDADFRTAELAGVGGSSAGANASLYAWALHPRVFRRVLAMSSALFADPERLPAALEAAELGDVRIWLDAGDEEGPPPERRDAFLESRRALAELLAGRGLGDDRLHTEVVPGASHHETAWADRFPAAVRFLFG